MSARCTRCELEKPDSAFYMFRGRLLPRCKACTLEVMRRRKAGEPCEVYTGVAKAHPSERAIWIGMIRRCGDSGHVGFRDYGGRGISVCESWRESFAAFLADMGPRPSPKHSIDRFPNNDGNYEPGNCRWATYTQQARNTRANRIVTWRGETHCISEWAEIVGLPYMTLLFRVRRGWPLDRVFTEATQRRGDRVLTPHAF